MSNIFNTTTIVNAAEFCMVSQEINAQSVIDDTAKIDQIIPSLQESLELAKKGGLLSSRPYIIKTYNILIDKIWEIGRLGVKISNKIICSDVHKFYLDAPINIAEWNKFICELPDEGRFSGQFIQVKQDYLDGTNLCQNINRFDSDDL
jgi:hypothetical protein